MWIIPSRGRPHNIRRLVAACIETGMSTPALLWLDDNDPFLDDYLRIEIDWEVVVFKRTLLSKVYNEVYNRNLDWYGFLADDILPETKHWDRLLVEAAGKDGLAFGEDGINGDTRATHFVVGGQLTREIGWLALPGLDRVYIDTVWHDIATERNVLRFLPEVKLTHLHFSNRRALRDKTYKKHNKDRDKSIYESWTMEYHNQGGLIL